jgi:hypothetical protein
MEVVGSGVVTVVGGVVVVVCAQAVINKKLVTKIDGKNRFIVALRPTHYQSFRT